MYKKLTNILSILGLILILAIIYFAGPQKILDALLKADFKMLLLGAAVILVIILLNGLRFYILTRKLGEISFKQAFSVLCFSQLINQGTVAALGEVSKSALFKTKKIPVSKSLAVVILERVQDFIFAIAFSFLILSQIDAKLLPLSILLVACIAFGFIFVLVVPEKFISKIPSFLSFVSKNLRDFKEGIKSVSLQTFAASILVTFIALFLGAFAYQSIFQAFNINLDPVVILSIISAGLLVGFLSGLPAGIGSREVTMIALFAQFSVPAEVVVATSLIVRVVFSVLSWVGFMLTKD